MWLPYYSVMSRVCLFIETFVFLTVYVICFVAISKQKSVYCVLFRKVCFFRASHVVAVSGFVAVASVKVCFSVGHDLSMMHNPLEFDTHDGCFLHRERWSPKFRSSQRSQHLHLIHCRNVICLHCDVQPLPWWVPKQNLFEKHDKLNIKEVPWRCPQAGKGTQGFLGTDHLPPSHERSHGRFLEVGSTGPPLGPRRPLAIDTWSWTPT